MNEKQPLEQRISELERRIRRLEYTQRTLDLHVAALENSLLFQVVGWFAKPLVTARAWLANRPGETRLGRLYSRVLPPKQDSYASWIESTAGGEVPRLTASLRFTILIVLSGPGDWLEELAASVRSQTYPNWKLCICPDASASSAAAAFAATGVDSDPRIHVLPSSACGVADALNQAVEWTAPDYLIVLDQPGRLAANALEWLADAAPAELIYSDEDRLNGNGRRTEPVFKPDWSPDLLLSCMYMGRIMAVSRPAWERAGRFRQAFEQARDYDLALRITDADAKVRRVARVLYHGRGPGAREDAGVSRAAHVAGRAAVEEALIRRGTPAEVEDGVRPSVYQLRWRPREETRASLVICSKTAELLDRCLRAVQMRTAYTNREIVVVQHLGHDDVRLEAVIERYGARRVPYRGPFNFSVMSNLGAGVASADVLVFLNDDTEPLDASWLQRLAGQVVRPGVGVVGARLVYPSGTLQHAGVAIGVGDGCGHIGRGMTTHLQWPWLQVTRDVTAVTGACLAIKASLFRDLGGFAGKFPVNYNDTDLCLRVRKAGYRVLYDAGVVLRHHECQTRGRGIVTLQEREAWFDSWGDFMENGDPFYSPHLTHAREDLSLRATSGF